MSATLISMLSTIRCTSFSTNPCCTATKPTNVNISRFRSSKQSRYATNCRTHLDRHVTPRCAGGICHACSGIRGATCRPGVKGFPPSCALFLFERSQTEVWNISRKKSTPNNRPLERTWASSSFPFPSLSLFAATASAFSREALLMLNRLSRTSSSPHEFLFTGPTNTHTPSR